MELFVQDLEISTYRNNRSDRSGWIQSTDVGVRITHRPTGIYAESHDDRSQHKNKANALIKLTELVNLVYCQREVDELREKKESEVDLKSIVGGEGQMFVDSQQNTFALSELINRQYLFSRIEEIEPVKPKTKEEFDFIRNTLMGVPVPRVYFHQIYGSGLITCIHGIKMLSILIYAHNHAKEGQLALKRRLGQVNLDVVIFQTNTDIALEIVELLKRMDVR